MPSDSLSLPSLLTGFLIFIGGLLLGMHFPDIDQKFQGLLHHRSIITHSLLLPWVAFLRPKAPWQQALRSGLWGGIGIHLCADVLSRSFVGYALIWFPWPFKESLGPLLSPLWLGIMGFGGIFLALRHGPVPFAQGALALLGVALFYAWENEKSLWPFLLTAGVVGLCHLGEKKFPKKIPQEKTS